MMRWPTFHLPGSAAFHPLGLRAEPVRQLPCPPIRVRVRTGRRIARTESALLALGLALSLGFAAHPLLAQTDEPPATEPVEDTRYQLIEQSFKEEQNRARYWRYGWMGFYAANAAYSFGDAATTSNQVNHLVGRVAGTQALIGVLGLALTPFPATHAATTLEKLPASTPEERSSRMKEAEALLRQSAESERDGSGWLMHAANFLVAGAGAAVIRYSYGDRIEKAGGSAPGQASINFWSSFLVGEVQIFTQPTRSIHTLQEFESRGTGNVSFLILPSRGNLSFAVGMRF